MPRPVPEMPGLPLCVVGAGSIGMRHVACAQANAALRLTAVVEPDPARRAQLGGLPVVATLAEVPPETRAAVVATPTPDHAQTALACLDQGWAVLVEKPVTETVQEGLTLCERAEALGLQLFVGHHRRCHPFVAACAARMQQIGQLVAVQGLWSLRKHDSYFDLPWRRGTGAGPIQTNLSHEIDLLHCLAGPVSQVCALTAQAARGLEIEDTAALALRFANGAVGTFVISDAGSSPWAFEAATGENPAIAVRGPDPLRFIGTAGALGFPSLEQWRGTDWQAGITAAPGPDLPRVDGIAVQLDWFAKALQGGGNPGLATGRDGVRTVAVIAAVLQAARTGQTQTIGTQI